MEIKRKIYDELLKWKNTDKGESALLIEGARRVGKSFIVEKFAKEEYKSYLLLDFSKAPKDILNLFETEGEDLDTLFQALQTHYKVRLTPRESCIIFDEVQFCPKARQMIKTLVADRRYDYIETGSLISLSHQRKNAYACILLILKNSCGLWAMKPPTPLSGSTLNHESHWGRPCTAA